MGALTGQGATHQLLAPHGAWQGWSPGALPSTVTANSDGSFRGMPVLSAGKVLFLGICTVEVVGGAKGVAFVMGQIRVNGGAQR